MTNLRNEGRLYFGRRDDRGDVTVLVYYPGTDEAAPLEHYELHSPGGFEWGYSGSGPSDLAIALLIDHLGLHGAARASLKWLRFPVGPHDLKERFVTPLSREPGTWVLTTSEIDWWAKTQASPHPGVDLPERKKDHWCQFCGGPHTMHSGNPYSHAVSCPIKPWSANWDTVEDNYDVGGDDDGE